MTKYILKQDGEHHRLCVSRSISSCPLLSHISRPKYSPLNRLQLLDFSDLTRLQFFPKKFPRQSDFTPFSCLVWVWGCINPNPCNSCNLSEWQHEHRPKGYIFCADGSAEGGDTGWGKDGKKQQNLHAKDKYRRTQKTSLTSYQQPWGTLFTPLSKTDTSQQPSKPVAFSSEVGGRGTSHARAYTYTHTHN